MAAIRVEIIFSGQNIFSQNIFSSDLIFSEPKKTFSKTLSILDGPRPPSVTRFNEISPLGRNFIKALGDF